MLKYVNMALQNKNNLVSYDINFLIKIKKLIIDGQIIKSRSKKINSSLKHARDVESIIHILRKNIPEEDLKTDTSDCIKECNNEQKQIILSEYFAGD